MSKSKDDNKDDNQTGWSQADRRMFAVTVYGGLVANIGGVLAVGLAFACVRYINSKSHPLWLQLFLLVVFVIIGILARRGLKSFDPKLSALRVFLFSGVIFVLLILVGYAAGIGK